VASLVTLLKRHPEKSQTTRMLFPTNSSGIKNIARMDEEVTAIPTSNLSPLDLVSSMVP
jgi:hypothetical protein